MDNRTYITSPKEKESIESLERCSQSRWEGQKARVLWEHTHIIIIIITRLEHSQSHKESLYHLVPCSGPSLAMCKAFKGTSLDGGKTISYYVDIYWWSIKTPPPPTKALTPGKLSAQRHTHSTTFFPTWFCLTQNSYLYLFTIYITHINSRISNVVVYA